jgi:aminoglycoside N3'-acetyltransferase
MNRDWTVSKPLDPAEVADQLRALGVTTLHLAELLAGVPYRRPKHVTLLQDGRAVRCDYGENDHCCQRFVLADDWLRARGLQNEGPVGYGQARLMRSRDLVAVTREQLASDPLLFLHAKGGGCDECEDAWRSVGGL